MLRSQKRLATRRAIATTATELFVRHGFDHVTVDQIAERAGVSRMTVFNHFSRKEAIFFDRAPAARELLASAVADRAAGETVLDAVCGLFLRLVDEGHPLTGSAQRVPDFYQTMQDSPALRAAGRELLDQWVALLEQLIREEAGTTRAEDPDPALDAALIGAVLRTCVVFAVRQVLAGTPRPQIRVEQRALAVRGFDRLRGTPAPTDLSPAAVQRTDR